jgi:phosphoribosylformylglycinamidine (FGAM) synthase-like enzyme
VGALFGEAQGRIVVSCDPAHTEEALRVAARHRVPARRIGRVTPAAQGFSIAVRGGSVATTVDVMSDVFFGALPRIMDAPAPGEA